MKKWYVYEIVNLMGTVEYVGESSNIKNRWRNHKSINGRFHNRLDVFMNVVKEFDNRRNALDYQYELQTYYGLETDIEKRKFEWTDVSKQKISTIHKNNKHFLGHKHTNETKKKLSEASKGSNNKMYGKKHSDETRKKMSDKLKGKIISDEQKQKLSAASKAAWIKRKQVVKE